jgi:hypothetical protein
MGVDFWSTHLPQDAFDIVNAVAKDKIRCLKPYQLAHNDIILVAHLPDLDLQAAYPALRQGLDAINWQLIDPGTEYVDTDFGEIPTFGIAPILPVEISLAFHATRTVTLQAIFRDGLLPSNEERRATNFPDTAGAIHVCAKLSHEGDENDSAVWWKAELREKNHSNERDWSIVRIDMSRLKGARVHKDMHSKSGIIIDKVERVPPELISVVEGY